MGTGALLEIEGLGVRYASGPPVLESLNLKIARGESAGLVGDSGCGKTTLAQCIIGLLPNEAQVSGCIRFDGEELLTLPAGRWRAWRGARIAWLSQEPSLSLTPYRRLGAQIAEVLQAHRPQPRRLALVAASEWLGVFFGNSESARIARSYPHELSGGERQRAAIARAVCCRPELLIADEPTASLDSLTQRLVLDTLLELNRRSNMAILLISHQTRAIAYTTTRRWRLAGGRVTETA